MRESLIPSLEPPAGSVARGSGSGGGDDEWEAHARIRTDLTPEQLLEHYGAQLRAEGWTPGSRTAAEGLAAEAYRLTDDDGAAWHGVLVASTTSQAADRFLLLRLTRVERSY